MFLKQIIIFAREAKNYASFKNIKFPIGNYQAIKANKLRTEGNKEVMSKTPFPSVSSLSMDRIWRSFQMCFDYSFNCNQFYGMFQSSISG